MLSDVVQRELRKKMLNSKGVCWAVVGVDAAKINEINTLNAMMTAMCIALSVVCLGRHENEPGCSVGTGGEGVEDREACQALIDGNGVPDGLCCSSEVIVGGDGSEHSIGTASTLAKVHRDDLMVAHDKVYPEYKFAEHKGCHTKAHIKALRLCPSIERRLHH